MDPADVEYWLKSVLINHGLGIDSSTRLSDTTVVVDQMTSPTGPCDWISVADHEDRTGIDTAGYPMLNQVPWPHQWAGHPRAPSR